MTSAMQAIEDDAGRVSAGLLGVYTMSEGVIEDIGYAYVKSVPDGVVRALLGDRDKRPWTTDQMTELLRAAIEQENIDFGDDADWHINWAPAISAPLPFYERIRHGPRRGQYDVVAEWRWATRVRNDLAHSLITSTMPLSHENQSKHVPGRLQLRTRSSRHRLKEITETFTPADLRRMYRRAQLLMFVLLPIYNRVWASTNPPPTPGAL